MSKQRPIPRSLAKFIRRRKAELHRLHDGTPAYDEALQSLLRLVGIAK